MRHRLDKLSISIRGGASRGGGFSLVEMLVVISLLVLLISLLLPSLGSAKARTQEIMCRTRLNEVGEASMQYRIHWRRSFGLTEYNAAGDVIDQNDNLVSLAKFAGSLEMFICPATDNHLTGYDRLRVRPWNKTGNTVSYESYGHFDGGPRKTPGNVRGKEDRVWLIFDMDNPDINHHLSHADNHGPAGGNVLYADGHVAWIEGQMWEFNRFTAQRLHLE